MVEEGIYSTTSALQNDKDSAVTTFVGCVKRILSENGIYLAIGDLIAYLVCVAACGLIAGGVGVLACLVGCLLAVAVGNAIVITVYCLC